MDQSQNDVLFKIAGDVEALVAALDKGKGGFEGLFGTVAGGVAVGNAAYDALKKVADVGWSAMSKLFSALPEWTQNVADLGDRYLVMSKQTGVATEMLSAFDFIATQADVGAQQLAGGVFKMTMMLENGSDKTKEALSKLGLTVADMKAMKPEDAFIKVFDLMDKKIPSAAERTTIGMGIFGRSFKQMAQLAGEDIKGMIQKANDLGLVWSQKMTELGDQMNDAKARVSESFRGLRNTIGFELLPLFTAFWESLAGAVEKAVIRLNEAIKKVDWQTIFLEMVRLGTTALVSLVTWMAKIPEAIAPAYASITAFKIGLGEVGNAVLFVVEQVMVLITWVAYLGNAMPAGTFGPLGQVFGKIGFGVTDSHIAAAKEDIANLKKLRDEFHTDEKEYGEAAERIRTMYEGAGKITAVAREVTKTVQEVVEEALANFPKKLDEINKMLAEADKPTDKGGGKEKDQSEEMKALAKTMAALQKKMQEAWAAAGPALVSTHDLATKFKAELMSTGEAASMLRGGLASMPSYLKEMLRVVQNDDWVTWWEGMGKSMKGITDKSKAAGDASILERTKNSLAAFADAYLQTLSWEEKLAALQMTTSEAKLAQLQKEREAMLAQITLNQKLHPENSQYYEQQRAAVDAYYDEMVEREDGYTADVARNAAERGYATKAELTERAAIERKVFNDMKAAGDTFTKAAKDAQEQRAEDAEAAAGKIKLDWTSALSAAASGFEQLANIAGDSMASVSRAIGTAIASTQQLLSGIEQAKAAKATMADAGGGVGGAMEKVMGGLQMAGAIGQMVSAVVQLGKTITALFKKEGFKDVMARVGHDWGVTISENLARAIDETAKKEFGNNRQAAELFHFDQILGEAGGLTDENVTKFTAKLRDVFSMVQTGAFTANQAREVLDKNFGVFADHVLKSGKIASTQFLELLALNQQFKTESAEMRAFVESQSGRLGQALAGMTTVLLGGDEAKQVADARAALATERKTLVAIQVEFDELGRRDYATLSAEDKRRVDDLSDALMAQGEAVKELEAEYEKYYGTVQNTLGVKKLDIETTKQQIAVALRESTRDDFTDRQRTEALERVLALQTQLATQETELAAIREKAAGDLDRQGRMTIAAFNASLKAGGDYLTTVENMSPALDQLVAAHKELGVTATPALQELLDFRQRVTDNGPLVQSAGALKEYALALSNIGGLNAESLADIEAQAIATSQTLTEAGFTEQQALMMQKGTLEAIRDAHVQLGTPIDENTQKLIDQAEGYGILEEAGGSTNDILKEGLGALITTLGGELPAAWQKMADSAVTAATTVGRATGGVAGAIETVGDKLADVDWEGWAQGAVDAAQDVQGEVDAISFGHSPGGLKEIPLKMAESIKASRDFALKVGSDMVDVADAVDGTFLGRDASLDAAVSMSMGGFDAASRSVQPDSTREMLNVLSELASSSPAGGAQLPVTLNIETYDAGGITSAIERKLLPAMLEALGANRGGALTKLQNLVTR